MYSLRNINYITSLSIRIYTFLILNNRTFDLQKTRLNKIISINSINEISFFVDIACWNNTFNVPLTFNINYISLYKSLYNLQMINICFFYQLIIILNCFFIIILSIMIYVIYNRYIDLDII